MESLLPLIIQLISGAVGGNAVAAGMKNISLGTAGNSLVGMVGGYLGSMLASGQLEGMAANIGGGGLGGVVLVGIVGFIKKSMAK